MKILIYHQIKIFKTLRTPVSVHFFISLTAKLFFKCLVLHLETKNLDRWEEAKTPCEGAEQHLLKQKTRSAVPG